MRRTGDLKGPGSKVSEVLTELFPVMDVERVPGELLILMGTDLCAGQATLTGNAGERPFIGLFNPADSGKLLTVTTVLVSTDVTTTIVFGTTETALTTLDNSQLFRDVRKPFNSLPTGQIRRQSIPALPVTQGRLRLAADTTAELSDENGLYVLPSGSGLTFANLNVATLLETTFLWRERAAEPSELNI